MNLRGEECRDWCGEGVWVSEGGNGGFPLQSDISHDKAKSSRASDMLCCKNQPFHS